MNSDDLDQETPRLTPQEEILKNLLKPDYTQEVLLKLREQILLDRAYLRPDFSPETINNAIAATAFSLGQLLLIDTILANGRIIDTSTSV